MSRESERRDATTDGGDGNGPVRSVGTVGTVAGLFVVSTAAAAYEIAPASVLPLVRESLSVSATGAGWLVSVMYATAVVASLPAGVVLDRVNVRRAVLVAGLGLLVAGAWGYRAAVDGAYGSLLVSRALGGLSYIVVWNAGANLAGRVVAPRRRATVVGVFTASAPVGFALGQFGGPLVAGVAGWPTVMPAFAALGSLGLAFFGLFSLGIDIDAPGEPTDSAGVRGVFADRAVLTLSLLCLLAFSLYLFLNSWLPSYLTDELGVSLAVGGLLTAVFPAVGVVSRTVSGAVSDRLFGGRRRPVVVLAFGVTVPTVAGLVVVTGVGAFVALVVVAGFGVQLVIGLLYTYVAEVVPAEVEGTAISFLTTGGMVGALLGPIAGGVVVGRFGYRPAFLAAAAVAALAIGLAFLTPTPGDRGTVEVGADAGSTSGSGSGSGSD